MCYVNGKRITDIGGIAEVQYNGSVLFSKRLFRRIMIVGDSGIGFAWSGDDGRTFNKVQIGGVDRNLKAVRRIGDEVYVAGDDGFLAKTSDLSTFATWTELTYDTSLQYIDICHGGSSIVVLAEGNKSSVSIAGSTFATVSMPGENLGPMAYGNGVFVSPSGTYGGVGAYSTNGGATWAESPVCATKRREHSGYVSESYPCRNICFGGGYFFSSSGVWDGKANHYEYSYSEDGVTWQKVEMTPGAVMSFCFRTATVYLNGLFYALEFREAHTVDPTRIASGTQRHAFLWEMDNDKHCAFSDGERAIAVSCGRYTVIENKIAAYRNDISDESCQFVRTLALSGVIRGVTAI